jgi:hypothetical protein
VCQGEQLSQKNGAQKKGFYSFLTTVVGRGTTKNPVQEYLERALSGNGPKERFVLQFFPMLAFLPRHQINQGGVAMVHFKHSIWLVLVLAMAFLFVGCAKPPDAEKSAAKTAMDAAMAAGADKFATADFTAAKGLWDTAEGQVGEKKYKEAKQGYIDAKTAFEKAAGAVEAGKKAMADEVTASVTSLEEGWKNLEAEAKKAAKLLKDKKADWDADAKAFTDGLTAVKTMIAGDVAGAKAKAGELKSLIEKWDGAIKELAAGPAKTEAPKK